MAGLFEELRRRNVIRVSVAYVVASWLILQFTDLVLENIDAPDWAMQLIMLILAIGFPIALILAWAFEMTPSGLKREKDVDRDASITPETGRKLDRLIIGVLVAVLLVVGVERVYFSGRGATDVYADTAGPAKKSIAVLPFADLSQNQDQEWFADGLAEEILNALTRTPDLLVSSRTSTFAYKGTHKDLPTIAAELGVAHILEGSVRRAGERLRVTAQLIRASDGFHLWSENYDRGGGDVIGIQEDLAVKIATALQTTMDPAALADMVRVGTRSADAYQDYIRGISARTRSLDEQQPELSVESYGYFEKARAADPSFSAAHGAAALFWKLQLSPTWTIAGGTSLTPSQMLAEFHNRIDLAIETSTKDDDRTLLRADRAAVEMRLRNSVRLYRKYLQVRPNDLDGWQSLIEAAGEASDRNAMLETLDYLRKAGETDLFATHLYMQSAYRYLDPSIAADYGLSALTRWPDSRNLMYQTHRTLLWAMRIEEAALIAKRFPRDSWNHHLVDARQACAEGRRDDVLKIIEEQNILATNDESRALYWHFMMMIGDKEGAIESLRQYESAEVPYQIASWLIYDHFDPGPFPDLMEILERENISRPPAVPIPFACPPE